MLSLYETSFKGQEWWWILGLMTSFLADFFIPCLCFPTSAQKLEYCPKRYHRWKTSWVAGESWSTSLLAGVSRQDFSRWASRVRCQKHSPGTFVPPFSSMLGLLSWVSDPYPSLSLSVWGPMSHHCHRRTSSLEWEYPEYLLWAQNGLLIDKLSFGSFDPTVLEDSVPCLAITEFWNIKKLRTSKTRSQNGDVF